MADSSSLDIVIPYLISNLAAVLLALCSWKWPVAGRILYVLLFGGACWFNLTTSIQTPEVYLSYAQTAWLPLYYTFITGFFSEHITLFVSMIAVAQGFIAVSLLLKGIVFKTGALGAIIFLAGISPLGMGSAFPSTLIMALGIGLLWKKCSSRYIWQEPLFASHIKSVHEKTI
jgi:hypothetical protein